MSLKVNKLSVGVVVVSLLAVAALHTVRAAPTAVLATRITPALGPSIDTTAASTMEGSVSATLTLDTTRLEPGERATGMLRLQDDWPEPPPATRLILAVDASGSMGGEHNESVKEALRAMIRDLDLEPTAGAGPQPPNVPNPSWSRVPVTGSLSHQQIFTVAIPPGWEVVPLQGIDSDYGEIRGDGIELHWDYGRWSNPLPPPGDPGYDITFEDIGCRRAKLVQPRSDPADVTGAYWADTGQFIWEWLPSGPDRLQISGQDLTPAARAIVVAMLRSVRFSHSCDTAAGSQVGIVEFDSYPRMLCGLMSDKTQLVDCINRIGAAGGTNISGGMETAFQELVRQGPSPIDATEAMVVFTDGANNGGCQQVLEIADIAKERGVVIATVSMGDETDTACMLAAASSPRHHYFVPDSSGLGSLFGGIGERLQSSQAVEEIALELSLPPSMMLVPDSASVTPVEADDHSARWDLTASADLGPGIAFEVEALSASRSSAGVAATYFLKTGGQRTFSGTSEPITVGDPPECSCPASDQAFSPSGTAVASVPAPFSDTTGCALASVAPQSAAWAHFELCGPSGPATILLSGNGTVGVYQPLFDPAFPCRFAVAASDAGKPFNVVLSRGPFTVAVFSSEANPPQRRLQLTMECSGVPPDPTPVATPDPRKIYLPYASQAACLVRRPHDLMLVVDVSHSMQEQLPGARTKLAAAQDGVDSLLGALGVDVGNQAGLVTFHETAELRQPLSADLTTVASSLRGVRTGPGTAIEAGLALARRELAGPRRLPASRGIIVLLTDGRSHPAPPSAAIAEAAAARSAGIQIWSIGIGREVDVRTLRQVAGLDARFRQAQRAEELSAAFEALQQGIICRDTR